MNTNSHQFADKARLIEALSRQTRFLLHRRRAGKIAHLPPALREQINLMLQDGLPYADIIARLGDIGKHLNKDNLSRWRKADHQDWLAEQTWLQATRGQPERPPEVKDLAMLLHEFDSDSLHSAMSRGEPGTTFVRVTNSVVRLATTLSATCQPPTSTSAPTRPQHGGRKNLPN